ncbi:hypothetical protein BC829DRAFT_413827 [Chytridium lagenaria]|nr:hypothetical protein BC829DRAFT_413827 [Chytridium lagenaria]
MSERIIGESLSELAAEGKVNRNEILLITKLGHALGSEYVQKLLKQDYEDGLAILSETAAHCFAPRFLEEEISRSLERFAFSHLEVEVKRGRIGGYGISSNTIISPDYISLDAILSTVSTNEPNHHLVAIGYPLNLFERESVEPSIVASGGMIAPSLASRAAAAGLFQLTQRPLNAISGEGGMIRCLGGSGGKSDVLQKTIVDAKEQLQNLEVIIDVNTPIEESTESTEPQVPRPPLSAALEEDKENGMTDTEAKAVSVLADQFQAVTNLEIQLNSLTDQDDAEILSALNWADTLSDNLQRLTLNPFATRHYVTSVVLPSLEKDLAELSNSWFDDQEANLEEITQVRKAWVIQYRHGVAVLCGALLDVCVEGEARANRELARVLKAMAPSCANVKSDENDGDVYTQQEQSTGEMAEIAVRIVRGSLNVATNFQRSEELAVPAFSVLVGMEKPKWAEAGSKMMWGNLPDAEELTRVFWCPLLDE